jgi:predicted Zn-dependent protease
MRLADGDATNAVIDLRAASKDQPGSAEVAGLLAQAHRKAGEPQLAREVLADAVKFKPDNADLRMLLAADLADALLTRLWYASRREGLTMPFPTQMTVPYRPSVERLPETTQREVVELYTAA